MFQKNCWKVWEKVKSFSVLLSMYSKQGISFFCRTKCPREVISLLRVSARKSLQRFSTFYLRVWCRGHQPPREPREGCARPSALEKGWETLQVIPRQMEEPKPGSVNRVIFRSSFWGKRSVQISISNWILPLTKTQVNSELENKKLFCKLTNLQETLVKFFSNI